MSRRTETLKQQLLDQINSTGSVDSSNEVLNNKNARARETLRAMMETALKTIPETASSAGPPPAYDSVRASQGSNVVDEEIYDSDFDGEDVVDEDEEDLFRISIQSGSSIRGNANVTTVVPVDGPRVSHAVSSAIRAHKEQSENNWGVQMKRKQTIIIHIDASIQINGNHNVVATGINMSPLTVANAERQRAAGVLPKPADNPVSKITQASLDPVSDRPSQALAVAPTNATAAKEEVALGRAGKRRRGKEEPENEPVAKKST